MAQTFVYLIYNSNRNVVKIGYGTDPIKRLSTLQIGCIDRLDLLCTFNGGISDEKTLHEKLSKFRIVGEWFEYTEELISVVRDVMFSLTPKPKLTERIGANQLLNPTDAVLFEAAKIKKLFTVSDLKKLNPNLNLKTSDIEIILCNNGYNLKTYKSSRMRYFQKP